MSTVNGVFGGLIVAKEGTGKRGAWKLYNILVDGKKYGIGFNPVKAATGSVVSFNTETNDKGYEEADPKSFRVVSEPTVETTAQATTSNATASKESVDKQSSIENQCVLKAAVELAVVEGGIDAVEGYYKRLQAILHPPAKTFAANVQSAAQANTNGNDFNDEISY